jgi:hypothetical protein
VAALEGTLALPLALLNGGRETLANSLCSVERDRVAMPWYRRISLSRHILTATSSPPSFPLTSPLAWLLTRSSSFRTAVELHLSSGGSEETWWEVDNDDGGFGKITYIY